MKTEDNTTNTPDLDRCIILMQALEELLHDLPDTPQATSMQVLAASVTTALARVQYRAEGEAV